MIPNKNLACRTKSLPASGRPGYGRKLKGHVSFSSLPPSKIEFEADSELKTESIEKNAILETRFAQFKNEKYRKQDANLHQENAKQRSKNSEKGHNDLDSVNELLMDVLEEIEAENVTIEDFLRDAVHLEVMKEEDARKVLPNFTEIKEKKSYENDVNNNPKSDQNRNCCEKNFENALDKLLDLFMSLKTTHLAKCCNYTIGKLCQLTSYEDYENTQKIAASSCGSSIYSSKWSENFDDESSDELSEDLGIDDFSSDASCISSSSLENFDSSSTGSDFSDQNVALRQFDEKENIRNTLPLLLESGALRPRQVWNVLETLDNDVISYQKVIDELLRFPEKETLKSVTKNINKISQLRDSSKPREFLHSSSPDFGYSSNGNESETSIYAKPVPFTLTSARDQIRKDFLKTSTPKKLFHDKENDNSNPHQDNEFIPIWCNVNGLHPSTSYILRCKGYVTEDDLTNISSTDMENFTELSWKNKLKLCIAIETLKLDKTYLAYHEKLRMVSKAFDNNCII